MNQADILKETECYVHETLGNENSGHDWWHIKRVYNLALHIAKEEQDKGRAIDIFIIQLAALLHDIADWKFNNGDDNAGPNKAKAWLESLGVDQSVIASVCKIILGASFKGAARTDDMHSIEGEVVQDADRLDALGAIGIARCFATGAKLGNTIHEPGESPRVNKKPEEYKKLKSSSINHFYEKLLLLKNRMKTDTGRRLAEERQQYMESFLKRFFFEWDGKNSSS